MLLIIFLCAFYVSCSGNNRISGTFEIFKEGRIASEVEHIFNNYGTTINFSGKNFTITECLIKYTFSGPSYSNNPSGWGRNHNGFFNKKNNYDNLPIIATYSEQMGRNMVDLVIYNNILKGTYSVTNDKIEFMYSDGTIEIYSFSRTENTVMIDGEQYNRRR